MGVIAAKDIPERWEQKEPVPSPKAENILLVDDLPANLMVYTSILEELGQNLMVVSSGEEALKLAGLHVEADQFTTFGET